MSGGNRDDLRLESIAHGFRAETPLRRAFRAHLLLVSKALHDVEWVEAGDCGPGDDDAAILACLGREERLLAVIEEAKRVQAELAAALKEATK